MADALTDKIIDAAIEVHRHIGPGLLELIYEQALCHELQLQGLSVQQHVEVEILYKGKTLQGQRVDLIVEEQVVVELKSVQKLPDAAIAQTLSYLRATGLKQALLLNFGEGKLIDGVKRLSL